MPMPAPLPLHTIRFKYYRQVRVHERFAGLSIAEPVHDAAFRAYRLALDGRVADRQRMRFRPARTRRSLLGLLSVCEDDDSRLLLPGARQSSWNDMIRLTTFQYHHVPEPLSDAGPGSSLPAAAAANATATARGDVDDIDNVVANIFISHQGAHPPIILVALAFPEMARADAQRVELLRSYNSASMFLCCCGQELRRRLRTPPCQCAIDGSTCSRPCVFQQTPSGGLFYHRSLQIVRYVRQLHPDASLWLTGFGFCGSLAALLTQAAYDPDDPRGIAAVSFNAPGDFWFGKRSGLYPAAARKPSASLPIYNVGIAADPVFARSLGAAVHTYAGHLHYQTCMRSGVDCPVETIGEKRLEYHGIGHLEDALGRLLADPRQELSCHITQYSEASRECAQYRYVERQLPSHYVRIFGGQL